VEVVPGAVMDPSGAPRYAYIHLPFTFPVQMLTELAMVRGGCDGVGVAAWGGSEEGGPEALPWRSWGSRISGLRVEDRQADPNAAGHGLGVSVCALASGRQAPPDHEAGEGFQKWTRNHVGRR
jgi:hypothetical protein